MCKVLVDGPWRHSIYGQRRKEEVYRYLLRFITYTTGQMVMLFTEIGILEGIQGIWGRTGERQKGTMSFSLDLLNWMLLQHQSTDVK